VIIQTKDARKCNVQRIKTNNDTPRWSEFNKRFYVWGFRWIKSRQAFSTVSGLHNFEGFEEVQS
jgi:hypothetical protein